MTVRQNQVLELVMAIRRIFGPDSDSAFLFLADSDSGF